MKSTRSVLTAALCFALGLSIGWVVAGKEKVDPDRHYRGKPNVEAANELLNIARGMAGEKPPLLISVARVYFLSGDTEKGEAIFADVKSRMTHERDWYRMGRIYLEAGNLEKAQSAFELAKTLGPRDTTGQVEAGVYYNLAGDRETAEEWFDRAFGRHPDRFALIVAAAGSYVGVGSE